MPESNLIENNMKIEAGKSYVTRIGEIADVERVHEPVGELTTEGGQYRLLFGRIGGAPAAWTEDGRSTSRNALNDLVAPYIEPQKPIVLQPGPSASPVPSEAEVWVRACCAVLSCPETKRDANTGVALGAFEVADRAAFEYRNRYLKP